jgi:TolB protein
MMDETTRILESIEGPVQLRPGFEDELFTMLTEELEGSPETSSRPIIVVPERRRPLDWLRALDSKRVAMASAAIAGAVALFVSLMVFDRAGIDRPSTDDEIAAPGDVSGEAPGDGISIDPDEGGGQAGKRADVPRLAGGRGAAPDPIDPPPDPDPAPPRPPGPADDDPPDVLALAGKGDDGFWHIYSMNVDGSQRRRLTDANAHDREPDWSPEGSKIVFVRLAGESDHSGEIYVMNANGSGERFLVNGGEPQWSPDGTQIVYSGSPPASNPFGQPGSIWVMDADGSDQRRLYAGEGFAADATWSPVGGLLAFAAIAADPSDPAGTSKTTNLFTMDEKGEVVERLTDTVYACNSEFSPDGTRLAFITSDGGPYLVWTMRVDGSDKTQLTEGPGSYAFPHWSPDGEQIAFSFDPDGESHWVNVPAAAGPEPSSVWMMRADGTQLRRISPQGVEDADPAFATHERSLHAMTRAPQRDLTAASDEVLERAPTKSVC